MSILHRLAARIRLALADRFLANITWLSLASIAVKPLWFLFITAACARWLGAEGYGVLNTALSLGAVAFSLTNFGAAQFVVRGVARDRESAASLFVHFLALRVGLVAAAVAGVCMTAWALGYGPVLAATAGAACVYQAGLSFTEYARAYFQAFEVLKYEAVTVVVEKALVIGGGIALLLTLASPPWVVAGMAAGTALTASGSLRFVARRVVRVRSLRVNWGYFPAVLPSLLPFGIVSLLGMMFFRLDTVMVEAFLGPVAAGQYGLPFRFVEALNMVPAIVVTAAGYPRLASLFGEGRDREAHRLFMRIGIGLAVLGLAAAAAVAWGANVLLRWTTDDPELQAAGPVLQTLCWAFPLTSVRALLTAVLLVLDAQRTVAGVLTLGVALNVGANMVLIPALGVVGAALTTLGCEALMIAVYVGVYRLRLRQR